MKILPVLLIAILVVGISAYSISEPSAPQYTVSDEPVLPSLKLKDSTGKEINLTDFKGKAIFVNLWASWCGPCRSEMPSIEALYKRMKNKNVAFVMITLDDNISKGLNYVNSQHFSFPVYTAAEALPPMFRTDGIPSSFFFNPRGEMIMHVEGSVDYNTSEYVKLLKDK
jgi:thiol-disulfide isomerase/thioredoxin